MNDFMRKYGIASAILVVAAVLILFGLFHMGNNSCVRPYSPYSQGYGYQQAAFPCQQVALGSNCLTLQIGVSLAGKGEVVDVVPGSPAARAGISIGDVINRINGR